MPNELPIGVFDSGLGGLSVLRELQGTLPNENFIYLGDVARLPYGIKSASVVTQYVERCVRFLLAKRVKAIVLACNTASAMALKKIQSDNSTPILGVIEPGVRAGMLVRRYASASESEEKPRILVLATLSTVSSDAYVRAFADRGFVENIEQVACPLLVPLAEEGWLDHPVTMSVIETYLQRAQKPFDALLLGCTHYPLLETSFRRVLGPTVALVHGARELARELSERLKREGALNTGASLGTTEFYATDQISASLPMLRELFQTSVQFERVDI